MQDYVEELLDVSWQMVDRVCDGSFIESELLNDELDIDECADL